VSLPDIRLVALARPGAVVALPVAGDPVSPLATALPAPVSGVEFLAATGHTGKAGAVQTLWQEGRTTHFVGTGDAEERDWRAFGAAVTRAASSTTAVTVGLPASASVRGFAEGLLLASYSFGSRAALRRVTVVIDEPERYTAELAAARAVAEAVCFARDLVNTPSNVKSPAWFAGQAVKGASAYGIKAVVREPDRLTAEGFNGVLAVGGGSARGPRVVELRYAPRAATTHVVLVGKGITFDTGGISIKPAAAMGLMKKDMGGGAAVIGAVLAAAALKLRVRVTVVVPVAENMPSGSSYRPGDVIRHYGGKTSEILNTDAEGRVVLADALAYAEARLRPDVLIDLATLTGAQSVALGKRTAALYSPSDELAAALSAASEAAGEAVWRMPLTEDYVSEIDSTVADVNNSAGNPGSGTAALYLRHFVADAADRWAHLDMSSCAWSDAANAELTKGGTGWGVRTLVRYLERLT
jgi:leucyl aminopeptidase